LRIRREEAPIDIGSISNIWVVVLCGGCLEYLLDEGLGLRLVRFLEEEFDNRCKDL